jgi:polyketide synthase PksN
MRDQIVLTSRNPLLAQHRLHGRPMLPGLAYIDLLLSLALERGWHFRHHELRNLTIVRPLVVEENGAVALDVEWTPQSDDAWRIRVTGRHRQGNGWSTIESTYATAEWHAVAVHRFPVPVEPQIAGEPVAIEDAYARYERDGLVHGPGMRVKGTVRVGNDRAVMDLRSEDAAGADDYLIQPALLDGCGIGAARLFLRRFSDADAMYLPIHIGCFRSIVPLRGQVRATVDLHDLWVRHELAGIDFQFLDANGEVVALLSEVTSKRVRYGVDPFARNEAAVAAVTLANMAHSTVDATGTVRALVAAATAKDVEDIDPDAGFYDLGLDSSTLLAMAQRLQERVGAELPPTLLFEYTSPADLGRWLASRFPGAFMSVVGPERASGHAKPGAPEARPVDVAIIGLSGRYPGAVDIDAFWDVLRTGADYVTDVPLERWDTARFVDIRSPSGKLMCTRGGFIDHADAFDARFFRITPKEAEVMDPQERIFLEAAWTAIEDAGYTPDNLAPIPGRKGGSVGVFAGVMQSDYAFVQRDQASVGPTASNRAPVANRVSYVCDFHGPSLVVDTACSSSLVAIHMAVRSLLGGDCQVALAGGVNLSLHPEKYLSCTRMDMHSSDGLCRSFGEGGDGYVPAEGVGVVVLKPLAKALADGDHIHGVIKATRVEHGGKVAGLMVPSPEAQAALIAGCLEQADIDPRCVSYIEAHGTGTALGDPIEFAGLCAAFEPHALARNACAVGSVKSNIGHAEAAAGMAGLTKLILQMRHRTLVPSLHADTINPRIDFANSPFYLQRTLSDWDAPLDENGKDAPRVGAVSAFGASGTNAHLVMEEFISEEPPPDVTAAEQGSSILVLSAEDPETLLAQARRLLMALSPATAVPDPLPLLVDIVAAHMHVSAASVDIDADWQELGLDDPHRLDAAFTEVLGGSPKLGSWFAAGSLREIASSTQRVQAAIDGRTVSLRSVTYTLQRGRRAMRERLALLVTSLDDLRRQLTAYLAGPDDTSWVRGRAGLGDHGPSPMGTAYASPHVDMGRARALAVTWVGGAEVVWEELYRKPLPRRARLPTYPFARHRFWVGADATGPGTPPSTNRSPQVMEATSNAVPAEAAKLARELVAQATGLAAADVCDDLAFEDLDLDSLTVTEIARKIESRTGIRDATWYFRCRTVGELGSHIAAITPTIPNAENTGPRQVNGSCETDVAIVGMAGRYPMANDLDAFWANLFEGRDCVTEIPAERWPLEGFFEPDPFKAAATGRSYGRWGAFLDGIDRFDPLFFGMTPKEAQLTDPQERLFLETAWACVEDAGYTRASLSEQGLTGVYVGASFNHYPLIMSDAAAAEGRSGYAAASQTFSIANRVSYALDLNGPSFVIDTACSSSHYALHLACEAIRAGSIAMAIAGGVNLSLHPSKYVSLSLGRFLSTDGRCRAFDEGGDGYVPGEAVGAVLLKRRLDAERDGDRILGVIRGSAVGHGGRVNGYSVPNPKSQAQTMRAALAVAGLAPADIDHMEAHGTGTALGDPVEISAIADVFPMHATRSAGTIASVKTLIGHGEAAAGITQLTKALLQIRHRTLVRNLSHGKSPNPDLQIERTAFRVVDRTCAWEGGPGGIRRAGIHGIGAGGASACLVVEEYVDDRSDSEVHLPAGEVLLVVSARNEDRMRAASARLADYLERHPQLRIGDVAHTLQAGRELMACRAAFMASTLSEAADMFRRIALGARPAGVAFAPQVSRHDDNVSASVMDAPMQACAWVTGKAPTVKRRAQNGARLVSLPTYPFEAEPHWVPGVEACSAKARFNGKEHPQADRLFAEVMDPTTASVHAQTGVLSLTREWYSDEVPAAVDATSERLACIVLAGAAPGLHHALTTQALPGERVVVLDDGQGGLAAFHEQAEALCILLKDGAALGREGRRIQLVFCDSEQPGVAGLRGMLRTAAHEYPSLRVHSIDVDAWPRPEVLLEWLRCEPREAGDVRYAGGRRLSARWIESHPQSPRFAWRAGAVILLTGGAGALATHVAARLVGDVRDPTIVLAGRTAMDALPEAQLERLRSLGGRPVYIQADISQAGECAKLIDEIVARYGALHGVIHCAGVVRDGLIARKSMDDLHQVLQPKVDGLLALDEATRSLSLDAFVCFSSGAGVVGNAGQADYAAANAFMDAFASHRDRLRIRGERVGRTVSIAWPFWRDGGMRVSQAMLDAMEVHAGMLPLSIDQGYAALADALSMDASSIFVASGHVDRLRAQLLTPRKEKESMPVTHDTSSDAQLLVSVRQRVVRLLADATGLATSRIDPKVGLDQYGIDSVIVLNMSRQLDDIFTNLPPNLFFEVANLDELARRLIGHDAATCSAWIGRTVSGAPLSTGATEVAAEDMRSPSPTRVARGAARIHTEKAIDEPIAIIGMAGRYPGASDLQAFWRQLEAGETGIGNIPPERWSLDGFYEPDRARAVAQGKSYSRWGGFLDGWDRFDAGFFGMSPLEAINLDPQIRLFIETCWNVLEDAGYTRQRLASRHQRRVGVFAGITKTGYALHGPGVWPLNRHYNPQTSFSSLVNRVSYLFDFRGPSLAFDTMCSSSLTAIHAACEYLRRADCEVAIAGGVNLYLHPSNYLELCGVQMLSSDDRCKSFGEGADGFVPGEGVGAVLLKPLSRAIADGDGIHAVILGSGINHGGKVNGFTVPNPIAQRELIRDTLAKAGVSARDIGCVEAHGTGTDLGDPIEVNALAQAFAEHTTDTGYCSLGSVKSNIGHLEAAAGIAGLTKAVLQLRNGRFVPTLHCEVANPRIDFAATPFVLQRRSAVWPDDRPRFATVSSFGAGGANAFVVLAGHDEARRPHTEREAIPDTQLIVLSAADRAGLVRRARDLLEAINRGIPGSLRDVAFTLQTGRENLAERLALVVDSLNALGDRLRQLLSGPSGWQPEALHEAFVGSKSEPGHYASWLDHDDEVRDLLTAWARKGKWHRIAESWACGADVDWSLFERGDARRISLPGYPFQGERMVLPEPARGSEGESGLHPLVQRNVSSFHGLRFRSRFDGREPFVDHHRVLGKPVFSATSYLAFAYRAVAMLTEGDVGSWRLADVVWLRPATIDGDDLVIELEVTGHDKRCVEFSIVRIAADAARLLLCKGRALRTDATVPAPLDLANVRASCRRRMGTAECYEAFRSIGLQYGDSFRAIDELFCGDGVAYAELRPGLVPPAWPDDLHPGLLDGALQASLGLAERMHGDHPLVPFSLASFSVHGERPSRLCCVVRSIDGSTGSCPLDITLCDPQGSVWVRWTGFLARRIESLPGASADHGLLALRPVWCASPMQTLPPHGGRRIVCVDDSDMEGFAGGIDDARIVSLGGRGVPTATRFADALGRLFDEATRLLAERPVPRAIIQVALRDDADGGALAGLNGFLKTLTNEQPAIRGQIVVVPPGWPAPQMAEVLKAEAASISDTHVRYRDGVRETAGWTEWTGASVPVAPVWRPDGIYVFTGGSGALAAMHARDAITCAPGARVILLGRREAPTHVAELVASHGGIEYVRVEALDAGSLRRVIAKVLARYSRIDGVVHMAGTTRDGLLRSKTSGDIDAVLSSKVAAVVALDEATRDIPLEFFVAFASTAGQVGNPGQADYAAANAFLDTFCTRRQELVLRGDRHGTTVCIDWPLWREGGMNMDSNTARVLHERVGMVALPAELGLALFHRAIRSGFVQLMPVYGDVGRLSASLMGDVARNDALSALPAMPATTSPGAGGGRADARLDMSARVAGAIQRLTDELVDATHAERDRFDADRPLDELGMESIVAMQVTARLEAELGTLSKTLFFEFHTLRELARHLAETFPTAFGNTTAVTAVPVAPPMQETVPTAAMVPEPLRAAGTDGAPHADGDIAIIGVAGRYPMAEDLDQFWINLADGRDCVGEIPAERWDHRRFFDEEKGVLGKTYCCAGGFLDDVARFDAAFFGISPREAQIMDPQERLFLECVFHTIEDAGYTRDRLASFRSVGVYVGVMYEEYQLYGAELTAKGTPVALAGNPAGIANRVSYFFNFHGPSMAIDTMCSSSLTAIHLACQSLVLGECGVAVAGGVNVSVHPNKYLMLAQGRFASSEGRCGSFGEGGDGYVPGEGVGAVLLKPLARAIEDGDRIHCVIKGSAINHGGRTNGYTVPNPNAQAEVVGAALTRSRVDVRSIGYVEAHGTGTVLGDPVEIAGLSRAFAAHTTETGFCAIGSVKSNIGHAESAAGIAALTKVLLQMRYGQLVPSLHSERLNPHIDFDASPFVVQRRTATWRRPVVGGVEMPRRAGISSFGAGGANAHMIVEEFIASAESTVAPTSPVPVVLSARHADRLVEQARRLRRYLDAHTAHPSLASIATTLATGREEMEERLCVLASTVDELLARINTFLDGGTHDDILRGRPATASEIPRAASPELAATDARTRGQAWIQGLLPARHLLLEPQRRSPVSLPGYPFATTRYWVPSGDQLARAAARHITSAAVAPMPASRSDHSIVTPSAGPMGDGRYAPLIVLAETTREPVRGYDADKPKETIALAPLAHELSQTEDQRVSRASQLPGNGTAVATNAPTATMRRGVRDMLLETLADALFADAGSIEAEVPFMELGVDSIIGIEWVKAINGLLGTEIPATVLYQHATIEQLASYLETLPARADVQKPPVPADRLAVRAQAHLDNVREIVVRTLADALFLAPADVRMDAAFQELGLDSVLGVEWVHALQRELGIDMSATRLYEYTTPDAFAAFVAEQLNYARSDPLAIDDSASTKQADVNIDEVLAMVHRGELEPLEAEEVLGRLFVGGPGARVSMEAQG